MPQGWSIDKNELRKMGAAIEKEVEKGFADRARRSGFKLPSERPGSYYGGDIYNYHAPVISGDYNTVAFDGGTIISSSDIPPRYLTLFDEVVRIARDVVPRLGLNPGDLQDIQEAVQKITSETVSENVNESRIHRSLDTVKAILSGVALTIVNDETRILAADAVDKLQSIFF